MTVAPEPIALELSGRDTWRGETQVFHDTLPWIGLRAEGRGEAPPAIVLPSGERESMLRVELAGQGGFWVENGRWNEAERRHLSALHRESGTVTIDRAGTRIVLDHTMGGAGHVDDYLADFRDEFVWLVIGADAKASGSIASGGNLNLELVDALEAFAACAQAIAERPASEMREAILPTPLSRVRPTAATFRHHARNPAARVLPGRQAVEALDTPENRYLRHMVSTALRFAATGASTFARSADRFRAAAEAETARAETLASTQWRDVDQEIHDNQAAERADLVRTILSYSDGDADEQEGAYALKLERPYFRGGFFYKPLNRPAQWHAKAQFAVARFPSDLEALIGGLRASNNDFAVTGIAAGTLRTTAAQKPFHQLNFTHVSSIRMRRDILHEQAQYRQKLVANGWRTQISATERRELLAEARTADKRAADLGSMAGKVTEAKNTLDQALQRLSRIDTGLEAAGVRASPDVPMGQRYVQSPRHAAGLKAYRALEAAMLKAGIGFDTLDRIMQVGVLHASALYERWCLVKIFAVLIEDYRFEPPEHWQKRLVSMVLDRMPGSIELRRSDIGMVAQVRFQATLGNGRRPDFMLRFATEGGHGHDDGPDWQASGLVLDAKFRTAWKPGALKRTLSELCEEKQYGQDGDRVFVLHPVPDAVGIPTSPLDWGRHCDYGQDKRRHRSGAIVLSAGPRGASSRLNLKRMIALELQLKQEQPPATRDEQDAFARTQFCVHCAQQYGPGDVRAANGRSGWDLRCSGCNFTTWRTYCYECTYPIFKNGVQMTYHRTLAHQITNIACAGCGSHFSAAPSD